ncbi:MAG: hypothetical protein ACRDYV_10405 [Acidimicrobiia bacterium]
MSDDETATDDAQAKKKGGGGGSGRSQDGEEEVAAPDEENRMESLLEQWNIPRPDIRPSTPEPSAADGPPVTAVAADQKKKGTSPVPDGLTLLFTLLVTIFLAGGGYVAYRNWSSRYQPA